ncbi:hypothetical protein GWK47_051680 [Chionoecetes opilio]|uniref:Uncharacterized protein n=1 Tax=Chionoecetes opilio TaxID=41210 RepID=A0A8J5CQJ8_CHIOP|nr:hypothetical protein GWK47_051680 [Chionoecetes opilio]
MRCGQVWSSVCRGIVGGGVSCVGVSGGGQCCLLPTLPGLSLLCLRSGWPLQLQHVHAQPPKCGFLGSPNRTPAGGNSFPRTGKCYGASSTSSVCSGSGVERSGFPRHRGGGGGVGESTDPHVEEEAAVWRGSSGCTHHGRTWIGPRSGALKLTSRIAGVSHWR